MTIVDQHLMRAPVDRCFQVAADVERWPDILQHYRRVRKRDAGEAQSAARAESANVAAGDGPRADAPRAGISIVEMSAWRDFLGPLRYPTWWVSEMWIDEREPAIHYRHIDGVTRGMVVKWSFEASEDAHTLVRITHAWQGPQWPLIGRFAWERVIAPHFVHVIASRTLAGVSAEAERLVGVSERASR